MAATSINGNVTGKSTGATLSKVSGRKRWGVALAAAVLAIGSVNVRADDFFQWANPAVPAPYIKAPQLTDASLPTVLAYLASAPPGTTLAVQVPNGATLSQSTINAVFNNYNIKYVFADYEGPTAIPQTTTLVNQVAASTVTGPSFAANKSFVGNYFLGPITVDTTAPAGTTYNSGNSPVNPFPTATDFRNTGVNMATETLYPGDSSFRNPVNGNSTAPNIRSALFTLPIQRLSLATQNLGAGQANIPYISRFNNWSNGALSNGGQLIKPTFLKRDEASARAGAPRVVRPEVSEALRYLMRLNAEKG